MQLRPVLTRLGAYFKDTLPPPGPTNTGYLSRLTRLGPMFTDPSHPKYAGKPSEPVAVVDPPAEEEDEFTVRERVRELAKRRAEPAALAELTAIRDAEYARTEPRPGLRRVLSGAAGLGRP